MKVSAFTTLCYVRQASDVLYARMWVCLWVSERNKSERQNEKEIGGERESEREREKEREREREREGERERQR